MPPIQQVIASKCACYELELAKDSGDGALVYSRALIDILLPDEEEAQNFAQFLQLIIYLLIVLLIQFFVFHLDQVQLQERDVYLDDPAHNWVLIKLLDVQNALLVQLFHSLRSQLLLQIFAQLFI